MKRDELLIACAKLALLLIASIFFLFPIVWTLIISLKTQAEALAYPPKFIFRPIPDNYIAVIAREDFVRSLTNSIILSTVSTALSTLLGALAAYALVSMPLKGKGGMFFGFFLGRIIPPIAFAVPLYTLYLNLNLINTHFGLILVYTLVALPFVVWMTASYLVSLPKEIEEAAMLDGASRFKTFIHIILPLSAPGIAAAAIFSFIMIWNEFLFTFTLSGEETATLTILVSKFIGIYGVQYISPMAATGILIILVPMIASWLLQRWIIRGLTLGAVK